MEVFYVFRSAVEAYQLMGIIAFQCWSPEVYRTMVSMVNDTESTGDRDGTILGLGLGSFYFRSWVKVDLNIFWLPVLWAAFGP